MTTKVCRRPGCENVQIHGRSYWYCSAECARFMRLERKRVHQARFKEKNPDYDRIKSSERYHKNPERWKQADRQRRFGLSSEDFAALLHSQDERCAVCRTDNPGTTDWHIDHDHACCPGKKTCGKCIRGLVCHACNKGLGFFRDNPVFLAAAIEYLKRPPCDLVDDLDYQLVKDTGRIRPISSGGF